MVCNNLDSVKPMLGVTTDSPANRLSKSLSGSYSETARVTGPVEFVEALSHGIFEFVGVHWMFLSVSFSRVLSRTSGYNERVTRLLSVAGSSERSASRQLRAIRRRAAPFHLAAVSGENQSATAEVGEAPVVPVEIALVATATPVCPKISGRQSVVGSACSRGHNNTTAIIVLNLLAGWTFVGWIVALVWAFTADTK